MKRGYLILDLIHVKNVYDAILNMLLTATGIVLGYFKILIITESKIFIAIGFVVFTDFVFGVKRAIKQGEFETNKALKVFWYLSAYSIMAGCVLTLRDAFVSAFWVPEAVMFPLLFMQFISTLKNASLSGTIDSPTLDKILANIDKYKEVKKD